MRIGTNGSVRPCEFFFSNALRFRESDSNRKRFVIWDRFSFENISNIRKFRKIFDLRFLFENKKWKKFNHWVYVFINSLWPLQLSLSLLTFPVTRRSAQGTSRHLSMTYFLKIFNFSRVWTRDAALPKPKWGDRGTIAPRRGFNINSFHSYL